MVTFLIHSPSSWKAKVLTEGKSTTILAGRRPHLATKTFEKSASRTAVTDTQLQLRTPEENRHVSGEHAAVLPTQCFSLAVAGHHGLPIFLKYIEEDVSASRSQPSDGTVDIVRYLWAFHPPCETTEASDALVHDSRRGELSSNDHAGILKRNIESFKEKYFVNQLQEKTGYTEILMRQWTTSIFLKISAVL